ncbi:Hypothetical protein FKW44_006832, partial [Caligus rogercresseyi]
MKVQGIEIWTVSKPWIFRSSADDSALRFFIGNTKAAFVQCGGAPSCITKGKNYLQNVAAWVKL